MNICGVLLVQQQQQQLQQWYVTAVAPQTLAELRLIWTHCLALQHKAASTACRDSQQQQQQQ
jgi:hypothetical protein